MTTKKVYIIQNEKDLVYDILLEENEMKFFIQSLHLFSH